jgi:hypothetical protein
MKPAAWQILKTWSQRLVEAERAARINGDREKALNPLRGRFRIYGPTATTSRLLNTGQADSRGAETGTRTNAKSRSAEILATNPSPLVRARQPGLVQNASMHLGVRILRFWQLSPLLLHEDAWDCGRTTVPRKPENRCCSIK